MLFLEWFNETERRGQSQQALVHQVADRESDAHVSNVFFHKTLLNTRFVPAGGGTPIRFVAHVEDQTGRRGPSELTVLGSPEGIRAHVRYSDGSTASEPYRSDLMFEFLRKGARHLP